MSVSRSNWSTTWTSPGATSSTRAFTSATYCLRTRIDSRTRVASFCSACATWRPIPPMPMIKMCRMDLSFRGRSL